MGSLGSTSDKAFMSNSHRRCPNLANRTGLDFQKLNFSLNGMATQGVDKSGRIHLKIKLRGIVMNYYNST